MLTTLTTVVGILICFMSVTGVEKLTDELFQECMRFCTNRDRFLWRLQNKKANCLGINLNHNTHEEFVKLINFVPRLTEPNLFNESSIQILSKIMKNIRLSEEFMIKLPDFIISVKEQQRKSLQHQTNIVHGNIRQFGGILFGEINYNPPNASLTVDFPFKKLLLFASRQISAKLHQNPVGKVRALDCWRFLYGHVFDYCQKYPDDYGNMPSLNEIYYLKDNPHKYNQLLFVEELVDKYGVIMYHDNFIYDKWRYGVIEDYITEFVEISTHIRRLMAMDHRLTDNDELIPFGIDFELYFWLKLLRYYEYDLSISLLNVMPVVISFGNVITCLLYSSDYSLLYEFLQALHENNGLILFKHTTLICDILNEIEDEEQCTKFLEIIVGVLCQHALYEEQIRRIAEILSVRFGCVVDGIGTESVYEKILELASGELFNVDILHMLMDIHQTYEFTDNHNVQSEVFSQMIDLLKGIRNDWNM